MDTTHRGFLHQAYLRRMAERSDRPASTAYALGSQAPYYVVDRTGHGLDATAVRALADGGEYIRTTKYVAPFLSMVPGQNELCGIFLISPVDDTHHRLFYGIWSPTEAIMAGGVEMPESERFSMGDRPFDKTNFGGLAAGREQDWGQDRAAMRQGHFSGFLGNLIQEDTVIQVSMGPIVDRTKEHLSTSDVAIIQTRRVLLDAVAAFQRGEPPLGTGDGLDWRDVVPVNSVRPADEVLSAAVTQMT